MSKLGNIMATAIITLPKAKLKTVPAPPQVTDHYRTMQHEMMANVRFGQKQTFAVQLGMSALCQ